MKKFNEKSEVSLHMVKVWYFMKDNGLWTTNKEIAEGVKFAESTVRSHTRHLVEAGIIDQMEVFPQHRFRISKMADKRNINFVQRIEATYEIFKEAKLI